MALSPSPASPIMSGSHRPDRNQSVSPAQQANTGLSKRDKRRMVVGTKLQEIIGDFTANRDTHYRSQLQALQIDANLVQEAPAASNEGLPNDAEAVEKLVRENMAKTHMKSVGPDPPQRAGRHYAEFAKDVNDKLEQRDADLATHMRDFNVRKSDINAHHAYKRKLADLEWEALENTVRDRVINSLTSKRARLMKEKESNEITDTPAYHLHPNQFTLTNPSSPGGIHGKRSTRHRRDAEEILSSFPESHKRKRKAHDSDESPAPTRQRLDNGTHTPSWHAERNQHVDTQINTGLYSMEKLFTEKELSMAYNTAALAAYSYMHRHPPYTDTENSPPNGKSDSNSENAAPEQDEDADSPPNGAEMARQISHATRSTRQNLGFDVLHGVENPLVIQALTRQIPKLPQMVNAGAGRVFAAKSETVPAATGIASDDIASELEAIRRARALNDEHGPGTNLQDEATRALLERAWQHRRDPNEISYFINNKPPPALTNSNTRDEPPAVEAVPMSQQNSQGVPSPAGGAPMSRQGTNDSMKKGRKQRAS